MTRVTRSVLLATMLTTGLARAASAQHEVYVEHAWTGEKPTSEAGWKPCSNGTCANIQNTPGLVVRFQRRDQTAAVEFHEKTTHVWYVIDGEATLVTGGEIVGKHQLRPGEFNGTEIRGGQARHLTKGDVIVIPPNTPHWWKEIPKGIGMFQMNLGGEPATPGAAAQ